MHLKKLHYTEHEGTAKQWTLEPLELGKINLIVGKNASGKSRTLSLINNLARTLSGAHSVSDGHFYLGFENAQDCWTYELCCVDRKVRKEELQRNAQPLLKRGTDGIGEIYAESESKFLRFQTPETQLAAVSRQDSIQHSFLIGLLDWARGVFFYPFGTPLGQHHIVLLMEGAPDVDPHDFNQATGLFRRGSMKFGDTYKDLVIEDMMRIGYDVSDIGVMPSEMIKLEPAIQQPSVLYVTERGVTTRVEQAQISQGMFRALSIFIQLNYGLLSGDPELILIDDIGEGLDFSRSCSVIDAIIAKVSSSNLQLVATTNDRFVMNSVDLAYWIVLDRDGSTVRSVSHRTHPNTFDSFKFTGLNNFDFLSREFFRERAAH